MEPWQIINELKRQALLSFIEAVGRGFLVVEYSEDVILGDRGFTDEEREKGIILVFNQRMRFTWDEFGISATLVFGTSPQKCFIPAGSIVAVYSPELGAQFFISPQPAGNLQITEPGKGKKKGILKQAGRSSAENRKVDSSRFPGPGPGISADRAVADDGEGKTPPTNVIKVDFSKKKK